MNKESFPFRAYEGKSLRAICWSPDVPPVGVVQIIHGMTEHMGRYDALARALTGAGLLVAGFDLRGHGEDVVLPGIASFGPGGWDASLEDVHLFFSLLEERFPGLPHFMVGFSLGSFLLREYLGRWPDGVAGAALLGTGQQPGAVLSVIQGIVKTQMAQAGPDGTTSLVRSLSFGSYNQKFAPNRTEADWLCADEEELGGYLQDPLCRRDISASLFWALLGSMKRCAAPGACRRWRREMPVLLLSGAQDPVGDMGKGVRAVEQQLRRAGLTRVETRLLPDARHDIFHEETCGGAAQAREGLVTWLTRSTAGRTEAAL